MKKTTNVLGNFFLYSVVTMLIPFSFLHAQTPYLVKDIFPGSKTSMPGYPDSLTAVGSNVYFVAKDSELTGYELWYSDGTEGGTHLVKEILPGFNEAYMAPKSITSFNGMVYFKAYEPKTGSELWRSDGTQAGTYLVKDIDPINSGLINQTKIIRNGNTLLFNAQNSLSGHELWRLGDNNNPSLVKDIMQYPDASYSSTPRNLTNMNGITYFSANYSQVLQPGQVKHYGEELWRTDGTYNGTYLIKDINCNPINPLNGGSSSIQELTVVNDILFFSAFTYSDGYALWRSDGTPNGTYMVKDIRLGGSGINEGNYLHCLVNVKGTLFFVADDGIHGLELWRSDGTTQGTVMVKDINESDGADSHAFVPMWATSYKELVSYNGKVYFWAHNGDYKLKLWKSDGTENGTVILKEGIYAPHAPLAQTSALANGKLYFSAGTPGNNHELYKTDGTEPGTVSLGGGAFPHLLCNANGILYYVAGDNQHGGELWAFNTFDPIIITQQPISRKVLRYSPVTFTVMASGAALKYKWLKNGYPFNDQIQSFVQGSQITIPMASINDVGDYSVEITDTCGRKVISQTARLTLDETIYDIEVFAKLNTENTICDGMAEPFPLVAFDIYNNEGGSWLKQTGRNGSFIMSVYAGTYTVVPRDLGNGLVPNPTQITYEIPSVSPPGTQFCFMPETSKDELMQLRFMQAASTLKDTKENTRFYPNPVKDFLFIETAPQNLGTTIKIYNALGELMLHQYGMISSLNLSELPIGIYNVQLQLENENIIKTLVKE